MNKVLIVDDERYICEGIKKMLLLTSFAFEHIYMGSNGKEAIQCIKTYNPDIVVSDVRMPIMDGIELAEYISKFHPHIKTVFISAYDEFKYAKKAIEYGVKGYLLKPIEKEELERTLAKIIGKKEEDVQLRSLLIEEEDESIILIKKVEKYVQDNYENKISLEDAARHVYISPQYLSRKFREVTGQNFTDYVQNIKIEKAKYLLRNSNLKVRDISIRLGFNDYTYFCKVFKKHENKTPLQYRAEFIMKR